jgi:lipoprotein-anchoring transpeptidase ErfK/SrfK
VQVRASARDPDLPEGFMTAVRRVGRFLSAALALTLVLGVFPAFADTATPTVTAHVTVAGTDPVLVLSPGMTGQQAHDLIVAACATPTLAPLVVAAAGTTRAVDVGLLVTCNVDGMVTAAVEATIDTTITPAWAADPAAVTSWIAGLAKALNSKPADAKRTIVNKRLKVVKERDGLSVDANAAATVITGAISAELAAGGAAQSTVTVPVTTLKAKTRTTNIGKTIIVVIHERMVYLYKNTKLEKKFRCAVGMRRYPTPTGTWKVVRKVKNPSWYNNGSAWARHMAAYIPPGRNNPLGTRALYLNADGIRIHGIPASENRSIGHAASHGCIRLKNSDALKIFPLVSVGTPVYIVK